MGQLQLQSGTPWTLLDAGLWFVFAVWAIALQLCRDDPQRSDTW